MKALLNIKNISLYLHILIWGALILLPYFLNPSDRTYHVGPLPGLFFSLLTIIHMALFYVNALFLYPKLFNRQWWWLYILSVLLLIFLSFQLKFLILRFGFPELLHHFGALRFVFAPTLFFLVLSIIYRVVLDKIKFEKVQKEKQAQQLATELKFLRSQINPHFLFNILTNFVSLARKKSDLLEPALIKLSEMMRYMIYESNEKKVTLRQEVEYLKSYIALQKLRFGNDFGIEESFELNEIQENILIEPMLLIPFVENAFKHGVGSTGDIALSIKLWFSGNEMVFETKNKINTEAKDSGSGIGLANLRSRLEILYPKCHHLLLKNEEGVFFSQLRIRLENFAG